MKIKVMHRVSREVMYAVNISDSGYVTCVDYMGELLTYSREKLKVIDPEYLPKKEESAKVSDFLPKDFFETLGKPEMSDNQSWE